MFQRQLKYSICVWCKNGCSNANNNKCEPKTFLDGKERAEPGTVKEYEALGYCLEGNAYL